MYRSRVPTGTRAKIVKFYYIYVLHNSSKNFVYIGYSEELKQRIVPIIKGRINLLNSISHLS